MKVMLIAHGHPSLHKGGGEVAAWALHQMNKEAGHDSVFVGWGGYARDHTEPVKALGDDDYLLYTDGEFYNFTSASANLEAGLVPLLLKHRPEVVHLHHYVHIGIDIAALIKQHLPRTKVVLTLHEYLALCMNNGQLLTKDGQLCPGPQPKRCAGCFPHLSEEQHFMRTLSIKASFSWVDAFISPSDFLRQKYAEWGLPMSAVKVIENPLPHIRSAQLGPKPAPKAGEAWVLGYFGQINYYKGLDIILDGLALARKAGVPVKLHVHGKLSDVTHDNYMGRLEAKLAEFGEFVQFFGPYQQANIQELMEQCHFLVMGSRWYENSPVVIQEAIAADRPVIAPGIGGMREKVEGLGLLFAHQSPESLASAMQGLTESQYQALCAPVVERSRAMADQVHENYRAVLNVYTSLRSEGTAPRTTIY